MIKFIKSAYYPALSVFLLMPLLFSSCKDEENPKPVTNPDNPFAETNAWIYSVMDEVNLYTEFLKEEDELDDTLEPLDYFADLKYTGDRFSVIYPAQTLIDLLEGIQEESGYEFQAVGRGSDGVVALIKYVKRNSPAEEAGLRRGDLISAVNGQSITLENYQTLLPQIFSNHTATYERFNETTEIYEVVGDVELNVLELEENPNLFDSVYTFDDKKIGYYFYNAFIDGPGDTEDYNIEMENIFAEF